MDQIKLLIDAAFRRGDHKACAKYIEEFYARHDAWHAAQLQSDHDDYASALSSGISGASGSLK